MGSRLWDADGKEYEVVELGTSRKGTPQATVKLPKRTKEEIEQDARSMKYNEQRDELEDNEVNTDYYQLLKSAVFPESIPKFTNPKKLEQMKAYNFEEKSEALRLFKKRIERYENIFNLPNFNENKTDLGEDVYIIDHAEKKRQTLIAKSYLEGVWKRLEANEQDIYEIKQFLEKGKISDRKGDRSTSIPPTSLLPTERDSSSKRNFDESFLRSMTERGDFQECVENIGRFCSQEHKGARNILRRTRREKQQFTRTYTNLDRKLARNHQYDMSIRNLHFLLE